METKTNIIYNEDCIEGMKKLPDDSVDCVITDPPYNFEAFGGGFYDLKNNESARTYLKKLNKLDCNEFDPKEFLEEIKRVQKKFNAVIFCNKFLVDIYIKFARDNNYLFDIHYMIKSNPIPAKNNHYLHDTEYIIIIKEKGSYFNNKSKFNDYRKQWKTTTFQDNLHPAQKPIELIKKYMRVLSKKGDIILDPFNGSGTTSTASKHLNRRFIAYEINNDYVTIGNKRLEQQPLWTTLQ